MLQEMCTFTSSNSMHKFPRQRTSLHSSIISLSNANTSSFFSTSNYGTFVPKNFCSQKYCHVLYMSSKHNFAKHPEPTHIMPKAFSTRTLRGSTCNYRCADLGLDCMMCFRRNLLRADVSSAMMTYGHVLSDCGRQLSFGRLTALQLISAANSLVLYTPPSDVPP